MCGHCNLHFLWLFENLMLVISFSTLWFLMSWWGICVRRSLLWKIVAVVLPCSLSGLPGQQSKLWTRHWRVVNQVAEGATCLQKGGASVTELKIEPRFPALRECRVWIVKIIFSWVFWWATVLMTAAVALNYGSQHVRRIGRFLNKNITLCSIISCFWIYL